MFRKPFLVVSLIFLIYSSYSQPVVSSGSDNVNQQNTPDSTSAAGNSGIDSLSLPHMQLLLNTAIHAVNAHADSLQIISAARLVQMVEKIDSLKARIDTLQRRDSLKTAQENTNTIFLHDRFALGYEEGISLRIKLFGWRNPEKAALSLSAGAGYQLNQQSDMVHRKLYEAHVKLGLFQDLAVFRKVRLALFTDVSEKMKQIEAPPFVMQVQYNRYTLWITRVRAGVLMNIFCMEHFMISYRFGAEFTYSTPPYIVDPVTKSQLIPFGNGVYRFGLSGSDLTALEMLITNIGIYIFF